MSSISVNRALLWATKELSLIAREQAQLEAELLLGFVLDKSKEWLLTHPDVILSPSKDNLLKKLVQKRLENWPIAYLIGHQGFYDLDFLVTPDVLIPRPETELLVELVLKYHETWSTPLRQGFAGQVKHETKAQGVHFPLIHGSGFMIHDVATGSGCIALTLAKHLPEAQVIGTDISEKALQIARKNQRRLDIKNASFRSSDLLTKIKEKPTLLTANLPYLTPEELKEPSIQYEPQNALLGGPDGLRLYEQLMSQLKERKWQNMAIFLEIGTSQAKAVSALARRYLQVKNLEVFQDYAGHDRVVKIEL